MRGASAPLEQAQDVSEAQAIEIFNSKFIGYAGIQSASTIKLLITTIQANNGANPRTQIFSTSDSNVNGQNTNDLAYIQASVNNQKKYKVKFSYATGWNPPPGHGMIKGYINWVTIRKI